MAQRAQVQAIRTNRIPPHNLDAEQSVLGAMLESKEAIANVIEILDADSFYKPAHGVIYDTILSLYGRNEPVDAITLADELARTGRLEGIGGKPYIHGLLEAYPTASSARKYARIIDEHAMLRRLVDAGNRVQEIGFSMPPDVSEAVDEAESLIYEVGNRRLRDELQVIRGLLGESMLAIEKIYERGEAITGVPSGFADLDDITTGFQPSNLIIVAARPSMGKCASKASKIDDPLTGERLTIADFVERQRPRVMHVRGDGSVSPAAVSDWIPNGRKSCWRLKTRTGRAMEVTDNHPFLTVQGWVPLRDLNVGRRIAVPRIVRVFGLGAALSRQRIRLMAYYIAEGSLTTNPPGFTNLDAEIIEDFTTSLMREFDGFGIRRCRFAYFPSRGYPTTKPNAVTVWLRELGLMGKTALQKRFPDVVWTFSKPQLAEFLRTLFSCDATIYPMAGFARIEFSVASEDLAQDVHHALLRFGIVAKLWKKTPRCWRVEITDPESVDRYQREIGWIGEKARRTFRTERDRVIRSNNGHLPPEVWDLVRKVLRERGMSLGELCRRAGEKGWSNPHVKRGLPQYRLARYAEVLDSDDLRWLANPDLYWDEVVSIEPVGEQEVYDLTVPDGSNFIAEDICVHNSSLIGDFALNAAKKSQPVVIFTLEMSRQEIVQRFLSSEARVDSQRIRKGTLQEQDWPRLSAALGRLADAPIFIDDSANISIMEMRAKCRRLKARHGLGLVIIDYLQLMQSASRSENRQQEVSEISRALKILARDLEVPVICASQLNRGVEYRADKRPLLADLRESGCLTGDTRIARSDTGEWVTMKELLDKGERNIPVWALDDDLKIVRATMTHVFPSGVKQVYRLRLRSGREIRASANHPFLSFDGWKRVDELTTGDFIASARSIPAPQQQTRWQDEHVILLAHLIGDGSFLRNLPLRYASKSQENLRAVADAAKAFGVTARIVWEPQARSYQLFLPAPYRLTHGKRNPIVKWLDELGLYDKRSHEKFVPNEIFSLPDDQIALFLRHLWATDGFLGMRSARDKQLPTIYYATSSPTLAQDVMALLLRLGIFSRRRRAQKKGYRDMHHVYVRSGEPMSRYLETVLAFGPKPKDLGRLVMYQATHKTRSHHDLVPPDIWQSALARMSDAGLSVNRASREIGTCFPSSLGVRRAPTRSLIGKLGDYLHHDEMRTLANSDVLWDEIRAIELVGSEPVYDATVPETHNFIANQVITHNSIEQDSDVVMFLYRDEVYNHDTDARGEAELIIAKHRNGPTGMVRLAFMNQYTKFASIAKG